MPIPREMKEDLLFLQAAGSCSVAHIPERRNALGATHYVLSGIADRQQQRMIPVARYKKLLSRNYIVETLAQDSARKFVNITAVAIRHIDL